MPVFGEQPVVHSGYRAGLPPDSRQPKITSSGRRPLPWRRGHLPLPASSFSINNDIPIGKGPRFQCGGADRRSRDRGTSARSALETRPNSGRGGAAGRPPRQCGGLRSRVHRRQRRRAGRFDSCYSARNAARNSMWRSWCPTSLFPTKESRAVLPDCYSNADAVFNVQRTALLSRPSRPGTLPSSPWRWTTGCINRFALSWFPDLPRFYGCANRAPRVRAERSRPRRAGLLRARSGYRLRTGSSTFSP